MYRHFDPPLRRGIGFKCTTTTISISGPESVVGREPAGSIAGRFGRNIYSSRSVGILAKKMCPKQAPQQSALNSFIFFELFATTPQPEPNGSSFAKPLPCEVKLFSRIYIKI